MSWWETLHLVTWWKGPGISAIKTGQDAPSWMWCTWRLSFLWGALSFYSVSCMYKVIFNPSLLNWSSRILTVAHVFSYANDSCQTIQLESKAWQQKNNNHHPSIECEIGVVPGHQIISGWNGGHDICLIGEYHHALTGPPGTNDSSKGNLDMLEKQPPAKELWKNEPFSKVSVRKHEAGKSISKNIPFRHFPSLSPNCTTSSKYRKTSRPGLGGTSQRDSVFRGMTWVTKS